MRVSQRALKAHVKVTLWVTGAPPRPLAPPPQACPAACALEAVLSREVFSFRDSRK